VSEEYFGDILEDYSNGVRLGLRVKLAVEFVKAMAASDWRPDNDGPEALADYALRVADRLVSEGEKKDWVVRLPTDADLPRDARHHAGRMARFQVTTQLQAQRFAQAEQPVVKGVL
jgi:hypothetical protein